MRRYASGTAVATERSQAEIKKTLQRYGADNVTIGESMAQGVALIQFLHRDLPCQIRVKLPKAQEERFHLTPSRGRRRTSEAARMAWQDECRRKWRVILLLIKAKLEAIEEEVVSPREALLSWLLLPNGQNVSQALEGKWEKMLKGGDVGQLLIAGPDGG